MTLLPSVVPDLVYWVCGPGQRPALVGSRGEADVVLLAMLGGRGGRIAAVSIAPRQGLVCDRRGTSQVREKREGSEAGSSCSCKFIDFQKKNMAIIFLTPKRELSVRTSLVASKIFSGIFFFRMTIESGAVCENKFSGRVVSVMCGALLYSG